MFYDSQSMTHDCLIISQQSLSFRSCSGTPWSLCHTVVGHIFIHTRHKNTLATLPVNKTHTQTCTPHCPAEVFKKRYHDCDFAPMLAFTWKLSSHYFQLQLIINAFLIFSHFIKCIQHFQQASLTVHSSKPNFQQTTCLAVSCLLITFNQPSRIHEATSRLLTKLRFCYFKCLSFLANYFDFSSISLILAMYFK